MPGLGGILAGGAASLVATANWNEISMKKKRVFVSFDFDNDKGLKELLVGQSRNSGSPFEVIDHSLKEPAPERHWENKAREAIGRAELVLVIAGEQTYRAQGVLKEVKMARDGNVRVVQVIGHKHRTCPSVSGAGARYHWTWPNLVSLLS